MHRVKLLVYTQTSLVYSKWTYHVHDFPCSCAVCLSGHKSDGIYSSLHIENGTGNEDYFFVLCSYSSP